MRALVVLVGAVLVLGLLTEPALAQDPGSSSTTVRQVPTQDIVPTPNSGEEPDDPGDRGGALQLALLGMLVVGVGGAVAVVVRQSRRARG